ncbi:MAG: homoserine dehydrogenase [Clostridia bacterium]|nr:homoserine dehydrogenase [Clostridia bacterium]
MLNVAVIGFGTVGSGVCELLTNNADIIEKNAGEKINLKYICDIREFPDSPFADKMVKDFEIIANDPTVDVVVETMGGRGAAYKFTTMALEKGKSVVTSNKEIVAYCGVELMQKAEANGARYLFEASTGGAIPALTPIAQCLSANRISRIAGILNGTTNYILTNMFTHGKSYDTALSEAQAKGYAEKDPTADVEGFDTCRKICILGAIMSDCLVCPDDVKVTGISKITRKDVEAAESFGCKIKLLGVAEMCGEKLSLEVSPYCIADNVPLYGIEDVFNGIMVDTDAAGTVMFYGRGAGKLPTASAVVSDIIDIAARKGAKSQFAPWKDGKDMLAKDEREFAYLMRVGGDVADFEKKFNICAHITEENVVAFVTDKFNAEEYNSFCKILEERGYSVISSYKVFA